MATLKLTIFKAKKKDILSSFGHFRVSFAYPKVFNLYGDSKINNLQSKSSQRRQT